MPFSTTGCFGSGSNTSTQPDESLEEIASVDIEDEIENTEIIEEEPEPRFFAITANALNVRAGAGTENEKLYLATTGELLQLTNNSEEVDGVIWYEVCIPDGRTGWCCGKNEYGVVKTMIEIQTEEEQKAEEIRKAEEARQAEEERQRQEEAQQQLEAQNAAAQEASYEELVWITSKGGKYHSKSSCSRMKNPTQVTISEAQSRGYAPCQKCHRW